MKKEMLINVMQPEECRIAIIEDGLLQELYVERASQESYVNNIYKGKIVNIEPSIQAAFVDFGIGRNGFLHVSDVASAYFKGQAGDRGDRRDDRGRRDARGGRGRSDRDRAPRTFEPVEIPPGRPRDAEPVEYVAEPPVADDLDEFGAGLDIESSPTAGTIITSPGAHVDIRDLEEDIAAEIIQDELPEAGPSGEGEPTGESEGEAKPKRRRTSTGKAKLKKTEAGDEGETKPKRKRVTKKKADAADAAPGGGEEGEDKPKYMGSAEHRTTGDEPEFYFDPMGPNDRFTDAPDAVAPRADHVDEEREEVPTEAPPDFDAVPVEESPDEPGIENNFAEPGDERDEFEDGPPRGRGDRDRDRGRGGRGRGDRDRDRGGRGRPGGGLGRGRDGGMRPPPIETIFKRGQEVIVQVIKEGMGTKGPTLSTHISIAGRYLVLAPWLNRIAVSRKITDEATRQRLKEIMGELNAPKGVGFIIRTAAVDRNVQELQSDLAYLVRLWEVFTNRVTKRPGPIEVYRESDMITRTIRDMFTSDIDAIYIDEPEAFAQAQEFMKIVMPRFADRLKLHADTEPIFHRFKIEDEVHKLQEKKVPLPGGGSLVIEQTEALVAIDVNSGTFRVGDDAEETAYQTNLQAAKEIARQLRLRNLGGVIINDFIDMKEERHRRNLEETFRKALRRDRSRTKILKTSAFGVIEMTRQRVQTSLKRTAYHECGHCRGTGLVKTPQSMSIDVMRMIQLAAHKKLARTVELHVHADVAHYLVNKKRREILKWEDAGSMSVSIAGRAGVSPEFLEVRGFDNNGHEVSMTSAPPALGRAPERRDDQEERDDRGGRGDRGDRGGRGRDDRGGRGGRGRGRGR
ncbi:MAG TPA: Rne/Rng family ribonuclease [Gemmataceae bacterium]|nr:Rne/Rng family ribonuclease [Gemmataceae bacterium]